MRRYITTTLLAYLLLLAAIPAHAAGYYGGYYGGHYGHRSGYGYGYGRHYGYGYGGHRRYYGGHRGIYYGRYGHYPYRYAPSYGPSYSPGTTLGAISGQHNRPRDGNPGYGTTSTAPRDADPAPATETRENEYDGARATSPEKKIDAVPTPGTARPGVTVGPGWARLEAGHYSEASSAFAGEAQRHPTKGAPKVGYALAAAATGDHQRGAWAMRRAFRIDADAAHYITLTESLRPRIEQILNRYQDTLDSSGYDHDTAFMVGALHYLLGNADSARTSIEAAFRNGDRTPSTINLRSLIDQRQSIDRQNPGVDAACETDAGCRAEESG